MDKGNPSNSKLEQLKSELSELEKKALEELQRGRRDKPEFTSDTYNTPITSTGYAMNDLDKKESPSRPVDSTEAAYPEMITPKETAPEEIHVAPGSGETKFDVSSGSKSVKTVFLIGAILFLVCILSIGAYYLATRAGKSAVVATPVPTAEVVYNPTPTDLPNPVLEKNTYISSLCSYSIEYPTSWSVEKDDKSNLVAYESEDFEGTISSTSYKITDGEGFGIYCEDVVDESENPEPPVCEPNTAQGVTCDSLIIGGLEAVNTKKNEYSAVKNGLMYTFIVSDPGSVTLESLKTFEVTKTVPATSTPTPSMSPTPSAEPEI